MELALTKVETIRGKFRLGSTLPVCEICNKLLNEPEEIFKEEGYAIFKCHECGGVCKGTIAKEGESHRCSRRDESFRGITEENETPDVWSKRHGEYRTCSYCGSLHPEDFEKLVDQSIEDEGQTQIEWTSKGYKIYANNNKFYTQHLFIEPYTQEYRDNLAVKIKKAHKFTWDKLTKEYKNHLAPSSDPN
jgi:hypothetical protein